MGSSSKRKRQREANETELPAEKAPRSQKPWIDQERKASRLPRLGAEAPVAKTLREAKAADAGVGVVGRKKAKRIAMVEAKYAKKEGKRAAAQAKALRDQEQKGKAAAGKQGDYVKKMIDSAKTPQKQQLLLASAAERISAEPEKQLELFEVFFALHKNGVDEQTKQLAVLSAIAVYKDLVPGYRIREATEAEKAMRRSKDVMALQGYEASLLQMYKRLLPFVEAELRARPEQTISAFAALVRVAYDFNFQQRLLASAVRCANSPFAAVRKVMVQTLKEMVEMDGRLEATKEVVLAIGRLAQSAAAASRKGGGPKRTEQNGSDATPDGAVARGFHKELFQVLLHIRIGKAADVALRAADAAEETDPDVKKSLQEAAISQSAEHMRKAEVELLTEIFVVYLRILRQRHLHNSESITLVLTGLARWAHQVNLELVIEIIQELRGVVEEAIKQGHEKVAIQALHCTFVMLSGPSQALVTDSTWLPNSFTAALEMAVSSMCCCLPDSEQWPAEGIFFMEEDRLQFSRAEAAAALEEHSMPWLVLRCLQAALQCPQAFGRASDAALASLVESLFLLAAISDPLAGLPLLRETSLLLRRHHRLYTLLDEEGGLFGLGGLLDRAVTVVWFLQAMSFSIVPDVAKAGRALRKLIPLRSQSLADTFPLMDAERWFEAEFVKHISALASVPKPSVASMKAAAGAPRRPWRFMNEADVAKLNLHRD